MLRNVNLRYTPGEEIIAREMRGDMNFAHTARTISIYFSTAKVAFFVANSDECSNLRFVSTYSKFISTCHHSKNQWLHQVWVITSPQLYYKKWSPHTYLNHLQACIHISIVMYPNCVNHSLEMWSWVHHILEMCMQWKADNKYIWWSNHSWLCKIRMYNRKKCS